jgi:mannosyltransferase OCH1-like enzyme
MEAAVSASPIPHVIHQTWKDADNEALVREEYPDFWPVYRALPFGIQRVDAVRYLILLRFGGLYADLDAESLQPFDGLTEAARFVTAAEP